MNNLDNYLRLIQSQIAEICEFKNFNSPYKDYKYELNEFKKFIIIYISGSLYFLKIMQHLKIESFKIVDPIYRKIYNTIYHQLLPFYKTFVQNDKITIGLFDNDTYKEESGIMLDVVARLGKFEDEIKEGYKTENPYFIEEFTEEECDEYNSIWIDDQDNNFYVTGRKLYFEYIRKLFLTRIVIDENKKIKVEEFKIEELKDDQFENLITFVKSISNILNNIEINYQMLSL